MVFFFALIKKNDRVVSKFSIDFFHDVMENTSLRAVSRLLILKYHTFQIIIYICDMQLYAIQLYRLIQNEVTHDGRLTKAELDAGIQKDFADLLSPPIVGTILPSF